LNQIKLLYISESVAKTANISVNNKFRLLKHFCVKIQRTL